MFGVSPDFPIFGLSAMPTNSQLNEIAHQHVLATVLNVIQMATDIHRDAVLNITDMLKYEMNNEFGNMNNNHTRGAVYDRETVHAILMQVIVPSVIKQLVANKQFVGMDNDTFHVHYNQYLVSEDQRWGAVRNGRGEYMFQSRGRGEVDMKLIDAREALRRTKQSVFGDSYDNEFFGALWMNPTVSNVRLYTPGTAINPKIEATTKWDHRYSRRMRTPYHFDMNVSMPWMNK
jgi:hypothetical protein